MQEIKISIIVPMYNAASSIERCLKSILRQSYENIEIILINDGSVDNSLEVASKLAASDSRLHIINIKNQGVSNARNIGIDTSNGDYIIFVDSDDYIDLKMIEILVDYIERYKADVVVYDPVFESVKGEYIKTVTKNIQPDVLLTRNEIVSKVLPWIYGNTLGQEQAFEIAKKKQKDLYIDCYNAPWQAVYKKDLVNDIRFNKFLNIYEDLLFNVNIYAKCQTIVYCEQAMYHYICNNSNSLATKYHDNYIEMKTLLFHLMNNNVDENLLPNSLKSDLEYRIVEDLLSILINETKGKNNRKAQIQRIKKYIDDEQIKNAISNKKSKKLTLNLILFLLKKNQICIALNIVRMRLRKENKNQEV